MAIESSSLDAAWSSWGQALVSTLFPAGLSAQQRFAFGQTTWVADFVNNDVQVINAQLFGIGDAVPAPGANFAPLASLSQAYGYFLQRLPPALVPRELAYWQQAFSTTATAYNMPTRPGAQVPPGAGQPGVPADTLYQPAYLLDSGFRSKYAEWQASSSAGRTDAGGVIRVRGAPAGRASALGARRLTSAPAAPALGFLKLRSGVAGLGALAAESAGDAGPRRAAAGATVRDEYEVSVAFTGLATFSLNPAMWFNETTIRMLADELSPADQAKFFAPDGILARRIYQVVLGFQPSVTLTFPDPSAHAQAQALLLAGPGAGVDVGPLSFDASPARPPSTSGSGITIGPTPSTLPVLLGVVSTTLATTAAASAPAVVATPSNGGIA